LVIFDAEGKRLRTSPLEIKKGSFDTAEFGPEGRIAAGYRGAHGVGVMLLDAEGRRLRSAPLDVEGGHITSVAFGPEAESPPDLGPESSAAA
jgi:hypothetical protein